MNKLLISLALSISTLCCAITPSKQPVYVDCVDLMVEHEKDLKKRYPGNVYVDSPQYGVVVFTATGPKGVVKKEVIVLAPRGMDITSTPEVIINVLADCTFETVNDNIPSSIYRLIPNTIRAGR